MELANVVGSTFLIAFFTLIWATLTDRRETAVATARLSLLGALSLVGMGLVGSFIRRFVLGWDWPIVLTAVAVAWYFWARRYHAGVVRVLLLGAAGVAIAVALFLSLALVSPLDKPVVLNGAKVTLLGENRVDVSQALRNLNIRTEPSGADHLLLIRTAGERESIPVTWDGARALADFDTLLQALHKLYGVVEGDPGYFELRINVWG